MAVDDFSFSSQPIYDRTTASAANINVGATGLVYRSTSSLDYKDNVQTLDLAGSKAVIAALDPIEFTSLLESDDPNQLHAGFGWEPTKAVDPRLDTGEENYDIRGIVAHLVNVVQELIADE